MKLNELGGGSDSLVIPQDSNLLFLKCLISK